MHILFTLSIRLWAAFAHGVNDRGNFGFCYDRIRTLDQRGIKGRQGIPTRNWFILFSVHREINPQVFSETEGII